MKKNQEITRINKIDLDYIDIDIALKILGLSYSEISEIKSEKQYLEFLKNLEKKYSKFLQESTNFLVNDSEDEESKNCDTAIEKADIAKCYLENYLQKQLFGNLIPLGVCEQKENITLKIRMINLIPVEQSPQWAFSIFCIVEDELTNKKLEIPNIIEDIYNKFIKELNRYKINTESRDNAMTKIVSAKEILTNYTEKKREGNKKSLLAEIKKIADMDIQDTKDFAWALKVYGASSVDFKLFHNKYEFFKKLFRDCRNQDFGEEDKIEINKAKLICDGATKILNAYIQGIKEAEKAVAEKKIHNIVNSWSSLGVVSYPEVEKAFLVGLKRYKQVNRWDLNNENLSINEDNMFATLITLSLDRTHGRGLKSLAYFVFSELFHINFSEKDKSLLPAFFKAAYVRFNILRELQIPQSSAIEVNTSVLRVLG